MPASSLALEVPQASCPQACSAEARSTAPMHRPAQSQRQRARRVGSGNWPPERGKSWRCAPPSEAGRGAAAQKYESRRSLGYCAGLARQAALWGRCAIQGADDSRTVARMPQCTPGMRSALKEPAGRRFTTAGREPARPGAGYRSSPTVRADHRYACRCHPAAVRKPRPAGSRCTARV